MLYQLHSSNRHSTCTSLAKDRWAQLRVKVPVFPASCPREVLPSPPGGSSTKALQILARAENSVPRNSRKRCSVHVVFRPPPRGIPVRSKSQGSQLRVTHSEMRRCTKTAPATNSSDISKEVRGWGGGVKLTWSSSGCPVVESQTFGGLQWPAAFPLRHLPDSAF